MLSDRFVRLMVNESMRVAMPKVNRESLSQCRVVTPPTGEQDRIAAFLDRETAKLDTLIAKQERLIEFLQEKRQALINHAVTKDLNTAAPMRPSGVEWLGDVPSHWDVKRIKWVARMESGHTPDKKVEAYWENCDIPWVSLNDTSQLRVNDFVNDTAFQVNALGIANSSARLLPKGTVVFSRDATVGLCAITNRTMAVSQHFIGWVCGPDILPTFLLFALRSMAQELEKRTMGATIKTIGMPDVRTLVAPVPPINEQQQIVSHVFKQRGRLDTDDYNVMIVANKFQTGFDQPLLVAMYVDKRLAGVTAVQTLSRLNRIYPDKDTTFVLDFVKQEDEILKAFRLYYRKAELSGVTDPNLVHDLQDKLDTEGIYTAEEVDAFVWAALATKAKQAELLAKLTPAVERFRVRLRDAVNQGDKKAQDGLELFRGNLTAFVRAYDFLSQIVDYGTETSLEKRRVFFRHLAPLLDIVDTGEPVDLSRVVLTHYNIRDLGQHRLPLSGGDSERPRLDPMTAVGSGKVHDPDMVRLREIIQKMNELFEGELTDADQINFVNHIRDKMLENPVLAQQAAANQRDQFSASPDFHEAMMTAVVNAYDNHMSTSEQVLKKDNVKAGLKEILKDLVYEAFAKARPEAGSGG
jgi:Type I restriction modification DNA specificity domain